jgi:hypothetical protein
MDPTIGTPDSGAVPAGQRAALWLPLLRAMTDRFPEWSVQKGSASALGAVGDVDACGRPVDFPDMEREFRSWVDQHGLEFVTVCRHNWRGPLFVAIDPNSPYLLVHDVKLGRFFRGSPLMRLDEVLALSELDALGFRRVRPGAEGVLKLLWNGMARGGRRNDLGLRTKGVLELLRRDPSGADEAARIVGPAAPLLRHAVREAVAGRWSRPALVGVELWCLLRGLRRPDFIVRQLRYRYALAPRCPVLQLSMRAKRHLPPDREGWRAAVAASHAGTSYLPEHRDA